MSKDLKHLLSDIGLDKYLAGFIDAGIDLDVLSDLESADFRELGVTLGDQRRILKAAAQTRDRHEVVERRFLSLLFIDVVGSTEMSTRMDPEDYRHAMFSYQSKCEEILLEMGGHLARKFGDGILAYFGFPQSREDDTRRAAQAALEIVRQVPEIRKEGQSPLHVRIGVATGMALVDENPSDLGRERGQVFGETPNLAARLHQVADANSVVICDQTHSILADQFEFESLGFHTLKGLPQPVEAWKLAGNAKVSGSGMLDRIRPTRPIVNRVEEIGIVTARWEKALNGSGQVVLLDGCAGIGKSSLVGHLSDVLDDQNAQCLYWQCDIDQRGRALHPIAAQIEQDIAQRELLLNADTTSATRGWINEFCPDLKDAGGLLSSILMVGDGRLAMGEDLTSTDKRLKMFELLFAYLHTSQRRHPVKLIIEDLHWIDPTTLEFLGELAARCKDWRMLVLCSQRDDAPVALPKAPNVTDVHLEALTEDRSREVLLRELEEYDAPDMLKDHIIQRCEGIPLYIEEVARAVLENRQGATATLAIPDRNLNQSGGDVPSSLLGLLLSRLDNRAGAREIATVASAIGRRFSVDLLGRLVATPAARTSAILDQLVAARILRRFDQGQYEFCHSVMQDAAYQVLLKERRVVAHRKIAEIIQAEFAGSPDTRPANIAHHYTAAEMWQEARTFWISAALEMQHFAAHREAVQYCKRALEVNAHAASEEERRDSEIEIRELMFTSQESSVWWSKDIVSNLDRIRQVRKDRGDSSELLTVVNGLAGDHVLSGRFTAAKEMADEMLKADDFPADIAKILACRIHGICDFFAGQRQDAIAHFRQASDLASDVDEAILKQYYFANVVLVSEAFIAWAKALDGDAEGARSDLITVISGTATEGNVIRKLYAQNLVSCVYQALHDPQSVLHFAEPAQALATESDQIYWHGWATIMKGWAHAKLGRHDAGVEDIRQGISAYESTGARQFVPYAQTLLCEACVLAGQKKEATKILGRLNDKQLSREMRFIDPMLEELSNRLGHS